MNPYDALEPEPRGMSGTTKVVLAFGIGCGILALVCCGVLGLGGVAAYRFAQKSLIDDPARVREITDEIVAIEVPDALAPKGAIDARIPIVGRPMMKGAFYMDATEKSFLLVGEVNSEFGDQTGEIEVQLKESMRQRDNRRSTNFEVVESEPLDAKINDEDAEFTISRTVDRTTNDEYWKAEGKFQGMGGPAILILEAKSPEFTKEQVHDIIKSMK
jgi:hypothetical protein